MNEPIVVWNIYVNQAIAFLEQRVLLAIFWMMLLQITWDKQH